MDEALDHMRATGEAFFKITAQGYQIIPPHEFYADPNVLRRGRVD